MLRRIAVAIAIVTSSISLSPAATAQDSNALDAAGAEGAAHRSAIVDLETAEARIVAGRSELAGLDSDLGRLQIAAGQIRASLPALEAGRSSADSRIATDRADLRRVAALKYVAVGSGRLVETLFSAEETLDVLRRQLLLDLAGDARIAAIEHEHGSLAAIESERGTVERRLSGIDAQILSLSAARDDLNADLEAAEARLPELEDTVERTRRAALAAIAPPTTVPPTTVLPTSVPPTTAEAGDSTPPTTAPPPTSPSPDAAPPTTVPPPTTAPPPTTTTTTSEVVRRARHVDVVGDSLMASARAEVRSSLDSFGSVAIDAVPGRALIGGQAALEEIARNDPDVVVIALGTNDIVPGADYGDLVERSLDVVSDARCVVWVDVQEFIPGLVEVNRAIRAAQPDAIAPWSDVAGPSELHRSDGYHLSADGQWAFAWVIAETVRTACGG